jgi:hypothetical protein
MNEEETTEESMIEIAKFLSFISTYESASNLRRKQMRFKFNVILLVALLCGTIMAQGQRAPAKEGTAREWKDFSSAEGQFTVCVPGTPAADIATVGTIFGPLKTHFFVVKTDPFLYYISYADLSVSPQTPAENKMALDQTRDRTAAKGRLVSENEVTFDGIVGREVLLTRNDLIQKGRFFYAKERFYLVIFTAPMNVAFRDGKPSGNPADRTELFETASKRFFDSFKLTK